MRHLGTFEELGLAMALLLTPGAAAAEEPPTTCEDSNQCRRQLGYGSVCNAGRCEPYRDETDLFIAVGLTEKQQAAAEGIRAPPRRAPGLRLQPHRRGSSSAR